MMNSKLFKLDPLTALQDMMRGDVTLVGSSVYNKLPAASAE